MKKVIILLAVLLVVFSCSQFVELENVSEVDGWTLSESRAIVTASKTLEKKGNSATVVLTGDSESISDVINGKWKIEVGIGDESFLFNDLVERSSDQIEIVPRENKQAKEISFKVITEPNDRQGLSGSISQGNWVSIEQDWVWWGCNAWVDVVQGNVDLYLDRVIDNRWQQRSVSTNPGTSSESVSDSWWWAGKVRVKAVAVDAGTSVFIGNTSF